MLEPLLPRRIHSTSTLSNIPPHLDCPLPLTIPLLRASHGCWPLLLSFCIQICIGPSGFSCVLLDYTSSLSFYILHVNGLINITICIISILPRDSMRPRP